MPSDPLSLITALTSVTDTKYSIIASFAFILYEHVITFDAEVNRIWKHSWSLGKILFLWTRYVGLILLVVIVSVPLAPTRCKSAFLFLIISGDVLFSSVEVILLLRVYAVYNRNKKLITVLAGTCLLFNIGAISMAIVYCPDPIGAPLMGHPTGCSPKPVPSGLGYSFVLKMVPEFTLCSCMVYKAWTMYKNDSASPMLRILVDDSMLYFFRIFVVLLLDCLSWTLAPLPLMSILFSWMYTIVSAMGCRLLLSMFEQAFEAGLEYDVTLKEIHLSSIRFAHP